MALISPMFRNVGLLALTLALASVGASTDEEHAANALATVKLMKTQGLDNNSCLDLANGSLKDVNDEVSTNNKLLGALNTGYECSAKGQKEVAAAQKSLDDAKATAKSVNSAVDKASAAIPVIVMPSISVLVSMGGSCDSVYKSDAYTNAAAAVITTTAAKVTADAAVVSYTNALKAAQDAANLAASQCRCDDKSKLDAQWAIASNKDIAATQASSWTQAQNILCALNGKSPCKFAAAPVLAKPALSPDTLSEACVGSLPFGVWKEQDDKATAEAAAKEVVQKETDTKEQSAKESSVKAKEQGDKESVEKAAAEAAAKKESESKENADKADKSEKEKKESEAKEDAQKETDKKEVDAKSVLESAAKEKSAKESAETAAKDAQNEANTKASDNETAEKAVANETAEKAAEKAAADAVTETAGKEVDSKLQAEAETKTETAEKAVSNETAEKAAPEEATPAPAAEEAAGVPAPEEATPAPAAEGDYVVSAPEEATPAPAASVQEADGAPAPE